LNCIIYIIDGESFQFIHAFKIYGYVCFSWYEWWL